MDLVRTCIADAFGNNRIQEKIDPSSYNSVESSNIFCGDKEDCGKNAVYYRSTHARYTKGLREGGLLCFGHWESMVCSVKIDMISPHFALHLTTLSDNSCSFMSLARRLDPRS